MEFMLHHRVTHLSLKRIVEMDHLSPSGKNCHEVHVKAFVINNLSLLIVVKTRFGMNNIQFMSVRSQVYVNQESGLLYAY